MFFTFWIGETPAGGEESVPSPITEMVADWSSLFPNFRVLGDRDVLPLLEKRGPNYLDLYQAITIPACKADLARLLLLYEHGGLYVDAHVGTGDTAHLSVVLERLSTFELILFDKIFEHKVPNDLHLMNTVLCARRGASVLDALINRALQNLADQRALELTTDAYVAYNIYVLTGAWDIQQQLFTYSDQKPISLRAEIKERVWIEPLNNSGERPFSIYKHYGYRIPGQHWSELQKTQRLFHDDVKITDIPNLIGEGARLNHELKYRESLTLLAPALKLAPNHHWINFQLGRAYSGIGDKERATTHFLAAALSDYPFRVGAMFEVVRHDLSVGNFDRVELLDQALDLPGDLKGKDEGSYQKRYYYFQIQFLRAMLLLKNGRYQESNALLEIAYDFSLAYDETAYGFDWLLDLLRTLPTIPDLPNVEYVRQRLLFEDMDTGIVYENELKKIPDTASVVEIGAMDGVRFDALHRHIIDRQWNAVLVEPLPDMFELLRKNYQAYPRVHCVNVAIAKTTGPLLMYRVTPEAVSKHGYGEWVVGISSAVKGPVLSYLDDVVVTEVAGLSFADFVSKFSIRQIDLLQIDTEGYDWEILKQIDLGDWNIPLVRIEIINLRPADRLRVFETFRSAGYTYHYKGMDVTAVRRRPDPVRVLERRGSIANPYANQPDYAFWRRAVSGRSADAVDPVTSVPFQIRRSDSVATAGSCFAQHISRTLAQNGFKYLVTENGPRTDGAIDENFGIFPARFGNIYTVRQLLQLLQRAYGLLAPIDSEWRTLKGDYIDPFRPQVQRGGFKSITDLRSDRDAHICAVREMFEKSDVFVFTLGLTEGWESSVDGAVFPLAPGVVGADVPAENYVFHNFTVSEMEADLLAFIDLLRTINPTVKIVLTVSPVSLIATFEDRHVLVSTVYSKAALRVVAEVAIKARAGVAYFPSYEIITGPQAHGRYFDEDLRDVTSAGVETVMTIFFKHYMDSSETTEKGSPVDYRNPAAKDRNARFDEVAYMRDQQRVVCDEMAIDP